MNIPRPKSINVQSILENEKAILYPLQEKDFELLYTVASDPEIWKQHPNKDRWKKEVFRTFFDGAMQSKGAFKIVEKATGNTIGSTRIYDYNEQENSRFIWSTFYGVEYWSKGINKLLPAAMLGSIFHCVSKVYFHIGPYYIRPQVAIVRISGEKLAEQEVTYCGEAPRLNFVYEITK